MNHIFQSIKNYIAELDKRVLIQVSLLMGLLILLNYTVGIEPRISGLGSFPIRIVGFFLLYFFVFAFGYWTQFLYGKLTWTLDSKFFILLILGPLLFAVKISWQELDLDFLQINSSSLKKYWQITLEWPLKCLCLLIAIFGIWKYFKVEGPVGGIGLKQINLKPYFLLLLFMVPLIAFAATQSDFLQVYPKLKKIDFLEGTELNSWWKKIVFELSYGTDFLSIEFFFRGFLILAFIQYAGKDAILPMAAFYCSIHFGKPLLECVSSYFGGMILGVLVFHSRTIWGGLLVHLGIAWLMELAGVIAKS